MGEEATPAVESGSTGKKSKLWLIIIIVLVVIGIGVGAYLVLGKKSSDGSGGGGILSAVTSPLNPNCKYNDPDLCKFMNNWKEVKYLTMNSTDTSKEGKVTTSVFKMQGDDNSQITMSADGKESYNVISLGKTTYTKDYSDNKWWKYVPTTTDTAISTSESEINFDEKAEDVEDKTTYEKQPNEACGKLTCFKYKVVDPANTDYTEYILFDNKDYQLRETNTITKDGDVSEATYDYSRFNLSEPSPIKEGSPYSNGATDSVSAAAQAAAQAAAEAALQQSSSSSATSTTPASTAITPAASSSDDTSDTSSSDDTSSDTTNYDLGE